MGRTLGACRDDGDNLLSLDLFELLLCVAVDDRRDDADDEV